MFIINTSWQDWLAKLEEGVRLPQTELCPNYLYSRVSKILKAEKIILTKP